MGGANMYLEPICRQGVHEVEFLSNVGISPFNVVMLSFQAISKYIR